MPSRSDCISLSEVFQSLANARAWQTIGDYIPRGGRSSLRNACWVARLSLVMSTRFVVQDPSMEHLEFFAKLREATRKAAIRTCVQGATGLWSGDGGLFRQPLESLFIRGPCKTLLPPMMASYVTVSWNSSLRRLPLEVIVDLTAFTGHTISELRLINLPLSRIIPPIPGLPILKLVLESIKIEEASCVATLNAVMYRMISELILRGVQLEAQLDLSGQSVMMKRLSLENCTIGGIKAPKSGIEQLRIVRTVVRGLTDISSPILWRDMVWRCRRIIMRDLRSKNSCTPIVDGTAVSDLDISTAVNLTSLCLADVDVGVLNLPRDPKSIRALVIRRVVVISAVKLNPVKQMEGTGAVHAYVEQYYGNFMPPNHVLKDCHLISIWDTNALIMDLSLSLRCRQLTIGRCNIKKISKPPLPIPKVAIIGHSEGRFRCPDMDVAPKSMMLMSNFHSHLKSLIPGCQYLVVRRVSTDGFAMGIHLDLRRCHDDLRLEVLYCDIRSIRVGVHGLKRFEVLHVDNDGYSCRKDGQMGHEYYYANGGRGASRGLPEAFNGSANTLCMI